MYSELARSIFDASSGYEVPDPDWFVRTKGGRIIDEMVDGIIRGTGFLALTGPSGSGKTTVAGAIREELVSRSVRVLSVSRGNGDSIRLRDIVSQLLGKPGTALHEDDIDRLFDVMSTREAAESRFVLMIDDAEVLRPGALEYLNLLSSVAMPGAPQVVFIGRPEFWGAADHAAPSRFKELITARWQLGRLSSGEARECIEQLIASSGLLTQDVFNDGGLDALIERSDGSYGRIVSLLSLARAMQEERHEYWLTSRVIDEAAVKLDSGGTASLDHDGRLPRIEAAPIEESAFVPETLPLPEVDGGSVGGPAAANQPPGRRRYACAAGLVLALFAAGAVPYWQGSAYSYRTDTPGGDVGRPATLSAPTQSRTDPGPVAAGGEEQAAREAIEISAAAADQSPLSRPESRPAAISSEAAPMTNSQGDQSTADQPDRPVAVEAPAEAYEAPHQSSQGDPRPRLSSATAGAPVADGARQQPGKSGPASGIAGLPPPAPIAATLDAKVSDARIPAPPGTQTPAPPADVAATSGQASPPPDTQPASPNVGSVVAAVLLARGNALLDTGDVAAARSMYQRAARANSGPAAIAMGLTYDPWFLAKIRAQRAAPDPQRAAKWYRRASDLGSAEAAQLLKQLPIASQ